MRGAESFRLLLESIQRSRDLAAIRLTIEINLSDRTLSEAQRTELLKLQEEYAPQAQRKVA